MLYSLRQPAGRCFKVMLIGIRLCERGIRDFLNEPTTDRFLKMAGGYGILLLVVVFHAKIIIIPARSGFSRMASRNEAVAPA